MYGNVTFAGGWFQNLGSVAFEQEGILIVTHRTVFAVSSIGLPQFRGLRQSGYSNSVIALGFILILSL